MKIKNKIKKKNNINLFNFFLKIYFYTSIILAIPIIILFFNTGYWSNYKNKFFDRLYTSSVINYMHIPEILYLKTKSKFYDIPHLNLNLSFENELNLENQRNNALEYFKQYGESGAFAEVNASIDYKNFNYKTNLRLKGDRTSHYFEKKRSSYKIDLKGNGKILGMEKFSLQTPRMRNYAHEWIFHELLGELGLIKLNYIFLDLSINGSDSNLYVLEEGFDKILIERNKKRNGPIFSLFEEFSLDVQKAELQMYNKKFWLDEKNFFIADISKKKLDHFLKNKRVETDIFDQDKWAKFFAITDLNFYDHARGTKSVKFYYNPVSGLIEPIGFDGHRSVPNYSQYISGWANLKIKNSFETAQICEKNLNKCIKSEPTDDGIGDHFVYKFFFKSTGELNVEFFKKYHENITKITSKDFLDKFFNERNDELKKINSLIYDDYFFVDHNYFYGPGLYYFSKEDIYLRAKKLSNYFSTNINKIFVKQGDNKIIVRNIIKNNLALKIKSIECQNSLSSVNYIFPINEYIDNNLFNYELENNLNLQCSNLLIESPNNKVLKKIIYPTINKKKITLDSNSLDLYKKYFYLKNDNLLLKKKYTLIKENVVIPKNHIVKILPGQKITLTNNAFIFSNSAWIADGSDMKIIISGESDNFGGGLLIKDNTKKSYFRNVDFLNLDGHKIKNQKLNNFSLEDYLSTYIIYGSVNFFNSNIVLNEVYFENICSEDALNIVSSNFFIENIFFKNNCSDSIDIDFGNGEIINAQFVNIDNDAIDFSGSTVNLENISLQNVGDKLISSGENSNISINNLVGNNSYVGVASKDGSITNLNNVKISNAKIALASYVKKNEYGPGKIYAKKLKIKNSVEDYLSDSNSTIIVDLNKINSKTSKILKIIYDRNEELLLSEKNEKIRFN